MFASSLDPTRTPGETKRHIRTDGDGFPAKDFIAYGRVKGLLKQTKRRRRVRASTPETGRDGNLFVDVNRKIHSIFRDPCEICVPFSGPNDQIRLIFQIPISGTNHSDSSLIVLQQSDRIEQVNGNHQGFEVMKPIGTFVKYSQTEIELCRRLFP